MNHMTFHKFPLSYFSKGFVNHQPDNHFKNLNMELPRLSPIDDPCLFRSVKLHVRIHHNYPPVICHIAT